jgi:hypothetical protein
MLPTIWSGRISAVGDVQAASQLVGQSGAGAAGVQRRANEAVTAANTTTVGIP